MRADGVGQVPTTPRAAVAKEAENIQGQVGQVEISGTCDALSHQMVATVGEEQQALFGAQDPRLLTIEMGQTVGAEQDGVSPRVREHYGHTRACCSIRHASTRGTIACRIRGKDLLFPRKSPEKRTGVRVVRQARTVESRPWNEVGRCLPRCPLHRVPWRALPPRA